MIKVLFAILLMAVTTVVQASSVLQIWSCTLNDGKTGADATAVSEAWLKAARSMKGGDQLKVFLDVPIAAEVGGDSFDFVLQAANLETWGVFNDGYADSPAQKADEDFSIVAECGGSSLWESSELEVD